MVKKSKVQAPTYKATPVETLEDLGFFLGLIVAAVITAKVLTRNEVPKKAELKA